MFGLRFKMVYVRASLTKLSRNRGGLATLNCKSTHESKVDTRTISSADRPRHTYVRSSWHGTSIYYLFLGSLFNALSTSLTQLAPFSHSLIVCSCQMLIGNFPGPQTFLGDCQVLTNAFRTSSLSGLSVGI